MGVGFSQILKKNTTVLKTPPPYYAWEPRSPTVGVYSKRKSLEQFILKLHQIFCTTHFLAQKFNKNLNFNMNTESDYILLYPPVLSFHAEAGSRSCVSLAVSAILHLMWGYMNFLHQLQKRKAQPIPS